MKKSIVDANRVSTRKKKHQGKRLYSQFNQYWNSFVIGNDTQEGVAEDGIVGPQNGILVGHFGTATLGGKEQVEIKSMKDA